MLESGEADGSRGVMQLRGSHSVPRETRYVLGGLHLTAPSFVAASLLKVEPATKNTARSAEVEPPETWLKVR